MGTWPRTGVAGAVNIAKAYATATGAAESDAADILVQYRKDHRVSIEDFASTVKSWIDQQGPSYG